MRCYQLLLRIYSTMEVSWMFYSFCGKPLPQQTFSQVCVSFQGCSTHPTQQQHGKYQEIPKMPGLELRLCSAAHMAHTSETSNTWRKCSKLLISALKQPIHPWALGTGTQSFTAWPTLVCSVRTPRRVIINSQGPPKLWKIWLQPRAGKIN